MGERNINTIALIVRNAADMNRDFHLRLLGKCRRMQAKADLVARSGNDVTVVAVITCRLKNESDFQQWATSTLGRWALDGEVVITKWPPAQRKYGS